MNANDTALAVAHTSSGAETLAKKVRKAHVVSAFSTVPSEVLFDVFGRKRRTRRRPSLLFCGDDRHAKKIAARLIRDVGFEPVDAGPLRVARYLEPFSLAVAQLLAYEGNEGPEIAYRIERFGKTLEGRHTHCKQNERQASNASGSSRCGLPPLGLSYGGRWFEKHAFARHRRVGALTAVEAAGRPLS